MHNNYQDTILRLLNILQNTKETNYSGKLEESEIEGSGDKYSEECCPVSKYIVNEIKLDRKNTNKIVSQNENLNIPTKRNGNNLTVDIELINVGFLDGIQNIETENPLINSIKTNLDTYKNCVSFAHDQLTAIINNDINTITKNNYNDINAQTTSILNLFKESSGPIIDNLRAIEEPNYENEFQTIRDNFNGLNDAQEAERKTEHVKHHKNGVKVTFYTDPNDYTGPTSVKSSAKNVIKYFEPHKWPDTYGVDGESGPNYTFRSNSWAASEQPGDTIGTKIKEIAADPQNVIEINAYGLWNLTVDIDYNDDGKNDKLEVTTPNSRYTKSDIKFKAEEHYKTIENFNKSLISFNPEINKED